MQLRTMLFSTTSALPFSQARIRSAISRSPNKCHHKVLCFVDRASLYNLVNKAKLVHNLFLVYLYLSIPTFYLANLMHKICFTISFISCLYMFRAHFLIIRRSKLHYTVSGIITPICARNMYRHEIKLIVKQILCIELVKY